jgi:hypothetical protein
LLFINSSAALLSSAVTAWLRRSKLNPAQSNTFIIHFFIFISRLLSKFLLSEGLHNIPRKARFFAEVGFDNKTAGKTGILL